MASTEVELVQSAARGNHEAFGGLVSTYQDAVYAVVLAVVRDFHAAQDVAQEVFVAAFRKLPTLRDPEKFPGWLRRMAINAARMRNRRHRKQPVLREIDEKEFSAEGLPIGERLIQPSGPPQQDDFERQVMAIVASLSEKKRAPVLLCYMNSLSRKEAAQFLGIRESTLRKRLHDAKAQLQREIVELAEATLQRHRLPHDFTERCICGCKETEKEVTRMQKGKSKRARQAKKGNAICPCGCISLAKKGS